MQLTQAMIDMRKAGKSIAEIARAVGAGKTTVQGAFAKQGKPGAVAVENRKVVGRSLAEFRQTYDKDTIVPGKVRAALKVLGAGWEYEAQFAKLAGLSLSDLGAYRDLFAAHVVALKETRRAWAGTVAVAKAMREMI
jgi:hypothetical protein